MELNLVQLLFDSMAFSNALGFLNLILLLELETNMKKLFRLHEDATYIEIAPISLKSLIDKTRKA